MIAFIDTSSLIKKYILEVNSEQLISILRDVSEIIVSPLTTIELLSGLNRRLRERSISPAQYALIEKEINHNQNDFSVVHWNDDLAALSIKLIKKYPLRTLDAIQLASAILSSPNQFITSDKL